SGPEAEIRHVVDPRSRLQVRRDQLQAQLQEWDEQQAHCAEQAQSAQGELEEAAVRSEELRHQFDDAQAALPDLETQVRAAAAGRDAMRSTLARIEQDLALAAQSQRDADRQLQNLQLRRERLEQELRSLNAPDPDA